MRIVSNAVQFVLLVLGLFSSYLQVIAPVADETLRIVPGGIASFSALLLLLMGKLVARWVPPGTPRRVYWLVLALVASGIAVWALNRYPQQFEGGTVVVPGEGRRVKGTELTEKAKLYSKKLRDEGHTPSEKVLLSNLGGIAEVWTETSIQEQWRHLSRNYVISVVSIILALSFVVEALRPQATARKSNRRRPKPQGISAKPSGPGTRTL